ncbi:MAG TPA: hypothetical protein DEF05_13325 [Erwinia sp.]|uniref:hypothetical protein n=1 Tax=Erwinia citreus TaxID=558 RepID=UPI000E870210|nr:hypothetical protein [Erwinia sp.]HBV40624.1 hypothetical protein [Erwinia sp.]
MEDGDSTFFSAGEGQMPLEKIIRIQVSGTPASNRRIWRVRYVTTPDKTGREFSVLHHSTLFNRHFASFLAAVKEANPLVE